ncbi:hypothetical protein EVAR_48602_1 [Eumeta japonica]|uniref:Uncharacterized protein n=1 Tax=Eumeta variegata TaxID=151549 RepID=A0A4C1YVB2_EUMVA|nr:hypothetical protein EVAR_48602_1 [Eumeta japonica]
MRHSGGGGPVARTRRGTAPMFSVIQKPATMKGRHQFRRRFSLQPSFMKEDHDDERRPHSPYRNKDRDQDRDSGRDFDRWQTTNNTTLSNAVQRRNNPQTVPGPRRLGGLIRAILSCQIGPRPAAPPRYCPLARN